MPLPRSIANLKRKISKKWTEAHQWAGGPTSKTKYRMPKSQRPDGTGLPLLHGRGKESAGRGRCSKRGVGGGAAGVGGEQEAEEPGAGEGLPLFLPTPDFTVSARVE